MKKNHTKIVRFVSQIFFFILITLISVGHTLAEKGIEFPLFSDASLHSVCPFGGIAALGNLFTTGRFIKHIHSSALILTVIIIVIAVFLGPVVCSYMCPLGSIQEWFGKIGKKLFKKRYNHFIPMPVDSILRFIRYIVLIWVLDVTIKSVDIVFINVDPYYALFNFWSGEAVVSGIIVLVIVLVLSLFIERPWCKYFCPFGALMGLTNLFSVFKIHRNKNTCIHCSQCSQECPMNISVAEKNAVKNHQCIRCGNCLSGISCPSENTVLFSMGTSQSSLHLNSFAIVVIILILLFGGIQISKVTGLWSTEADKTPQKFEQGPAVGHYNPEDIRGSYTFADIENSFNIPSATIAEAFGIQTQTPRTIKVKELKEIYADLPAGMEIGTSSVRFFVALYNNLPYESEDGIPASAVEILKRDGKWNADTETRLQGKILNILKK